MVSDPIDFLVVLGWMARHYAWTQCSTRLVLSNKTHDLTIKFPPPGVEAGVPVGPTDATVIDNKFVVLDTYGSGVAFFDFNGTLLKRVSLPKDIQYPKYSPR